MKVLVACEFSATVGRAFQDRGHEVLTCDLLPTEDKSVPHYHGDIMDLIYDCQVGWELMVAHPPCTYLANSGVRWLYEDGKPNRKRWRNMEEAADLFRKLYFAPIPRVAIENPIMHKHGKEAIGYGEHWQQDQLIQPWQFGHGETKAICLWLKNLPLLKPTNVVDGREARVHRMAPGPDRQKERSRFFTGVAEAMADQWG